VFLLREFTRGFFQSSILHLLLINLLVNFVKRKAFIYEVSEDGTRAIFIDVYNAESILVFAKDHRKKFAYITRSILEKVVNREIYGNEYFGTIRNVKAMKAFKGGSNPRIYCREETIEGKVVCIVCCAHLAKKKTKGISGVTRRLIEQVSQYEYDHQQLKDEYDRETSRRFQKPTRAKD